MYYRMYNFFRRVSVLYGRYVRLWSLIDTK